jgi:general secretion pathway protein G
MRIRREGRVLARAAFTLMEMLVVVAILVVLAGAGGMIYMRYLDDARKDTARTQCKTVLAQAAAAYQLKYGDFPASLETLTQPTSDGGKPFLETSALVDPWGRAYQYAVPGPHHPTTGEPDIWSQGGNLGDPAGTIGNW